MFSYRLYNLSYDPINFYIDEPSPHITISRNNNTSTGIIDNQSIEISISKDLTENVILKYVCTSHSNMSGQFTISNQTDNIVDNNNAAKVEIEDLIMGDSAIENRLAKAGEERIIRYGPK